MSFALITGASKGIGKSFAEVLAKKKYDLLLVARSAQELEEVCNEIAGKYKIVCKFFAVDLSEPDSTKKISDWIERDGYDVSILINNAGYSLWGPFHELSLEEQNAMMAVNIDAVVNLSHILIPKLMKQKKAYILNVASSTAYQAIPTMNIYAASKAFVVSFSRSLHFELRNTSVSVSVLSPGGAKTNFVQRARMPHMQKKSDQFSMEPEAVAEAGIRGMFAGKTEIIPGLLNQIGAFSNRIMPKALVEKVAAGIYVKKEK